MQIRVIIFAGQLALTINLGHHSNQGALNASQMDILSIQICLFLVLYFFSRVESQSCANLWHPSSHTHNLKKGRQILDATVSFRTKPCQCNTIYYSFETGQWDCGRAQSGSRIWIWNPFKKQQWIISIAHHTYDMYKLGVIQFYAIFPCNRFCNLYSLV